MYRLVVIDTDDRALNCITRSIDWNALGFDVVATFSDGEEALDYLKCMPADAVLLPAELPETTGMDVAEFIHQNLSGCAVVMMGTDRDFGLMKRAMQCGVYDYILKPVDPEELRGSLEMLREKLDRAKQASARYSKRKHKQASDQSGKQYKEHHGSAALVRQATAYIDQHILEGVSLDKVSEYVHISSSHLIRVFKKETGYTYLEYVTRKKMELAADFLAKGDLKVYEVSERLGYRSTRHFSALFLRQFGYYPSEYAEALTDQEMVL